MPSGRSASLDRAAPKDEAKKKAASSSMFSGSMFSSSFFGPSRPKLVGERCVMADGSHGTVGRDRGKSLIVIRDDGARCVAATGDVAIVDEPVPPDAVHHFLMYRDAKVRPGGWTEDDPTGVVARHAVLRGNTHVLHGDETLEGATGVVLAVHAVDRTVFRVAVMDGRTISVRRRNLHLFDPEPDAVITTGVLKKVASPGKGGSAKKKRVAVAGGDDDGTITATIASSGSKNLALNSARSPDEDRGGRGRARSGSKESGNSSAPSFREGLFPGAGPASPRGKNPLGAQGGADTRPFFEPGPSASGDLRKFAEVFLPLAGTSAEAKKLRRKAWALADGNGNGLCSLSEIETFVLKALVARYPRQPGGEEPGKDLFDAFRCDPPPCARSGQRFGAYAQRRRAHSCTRTHHLPPRPPTTTTTRTARAACTAPFTHATPMH